MFNRLVNYWKNPKVLGNVIMYRTARLWPHDLYLKILYRILVGKKLNLKNPQTLGDKLNWLKLYYHKKVFTTMVDKYEVKQFVRERIGDKYVVPCYGVWDSPDSIEWDKLPEKFVLKCTHDSGSFIVCKDKKTFDKEAAIRKLKKCQTKEYYWGTREWPYKNVKRRVIAEQYIDGLGKDDSIEYKVTCMNGEVKFVTVCKGPAHQALELRKNDHFTPKEWKRLDWWTFYEPSRTDYERPVFMDEMVELCEKLAKDVPYLRVDWYVTDGKIYFGEMTFYTWAGFLVFNPDNWDSILGSWMTLPERYIEED